MWPEDVEFSERDRIVQRLYNEERTIEREIDVVGREVIVSVSRVRARVGTGSRARGRAWVGFPGEVVRRAVVRAPGEVWARA